MPKKNARETGRTNTINPQSTGSRLCKQRSDGHILLSTDRMGNITRVNRFGETFFGMREKDVVGKKFSQIVRPDDFEFDGKKKRFLNYFLHTPEKNDFAEFETRHVSGRHRRVAWNRSALRNSEGAFVEMLHVGVDVQDASDDLFEAPAPDETGICQPNADYSILEKYIENSKAWAWEVNADAELCYVSPGIKKLLGYSQEELIGVEMDFLLRRDARSRFRHALEDAVKTGSRRFRFESQFQRKNGELVWFETAGAIFCDENDLFTGARGLNRDVTREIAVKEELVLQEKEYRYLFDNTQVGLMMLSEEGVILNINRTGAKMHGREPEEMVGRKIFEYILSSEREDVIDAFSRIYRNAKTQKGHFVDIEPHMIRVTTARGTGYLRLVPKAIKVMEHGEMVGILNTVLDITESHLLQKELERHQLQLQQLVDERTEAIQTLQDEMLRDERLMTLGRLTSTVSHEIRNPLGTVNSSLYIINERLKGMDYGVGKAVDRAGRAIRRCDGIIEEMLDFTRTKGLEKRIIDISSWLEKILDEVRAPQNVSIIKLIDNGLSAPVDAGRLHRCVLNALENSLTAIGEESEGIIRVSARLSGGLLEISIRDNGPGISKKLQKRVFDPLYSTNQNGIGMGLPICKQVMELHGGSISLRSDKGRGTSIVLRLPMPRRD